MLRQDRRVSSRNEDRVLGCSDYGEDNEGEGSHASLHDYIKFVFYCMLLAVPLYAITMSVIKQDWIMVIIDALIVPVGFLHGLLLIFGFTA
jgi:hypothetical protein